MSLIDRICGKDRQLGCEPPVIHFKDCLHGVSDLFASELGFVRLLRNTGGSGKLVNTSLGLTSITRMLCFRSSALHSVMLRSTNLLA